MESRGYLVFFMGGGEKLEMVKFSVLEGRHVGGHIIGAFKECNRSICDQLSNEAFYIEILVTYD